MRILWLSHLVPYPPKGGVLQRSYHLLRETSKYHEVDLLAFHQPNLHKPIFNSVEEGLTISKNELGKLCNNINIFDIDSTNKKFGSIQLALKSLFTKDPYNINWLKSEIFLTALRSHLENNHYDAVHFDTISLAPYFSEISEIACILDHHNIESDTLIHRANKENNFLKRYYFLQEGRRLQQYEKKYCPEFSLNITCSDLDTRLLADLTKTNNIVTIPNGVDTNDFDPQHAIKYASKDKNIVFIGRLNWYPNAEAVTYIAQQIWPGLKRKISNIHCDIVGSNPPKTITELARVDHNFRVHGFVDNIYPFMTATSIYVCPITNGGGTKLKILDALAMGMPVIAHPFACEGINVTDGKDVIFAETADEFIDAITDLFDDVKLLKTLSSNARLLILSEYSYASIGKKYSDELEELSSMMT